MTSPFLSTRDAEAPANIIKMGQDFGSPRVAIARAGAPLPMEAAKEATEADLMIPVFVGEKDAILAEAAALNWDISGFALHDTNGEEEAGMTAARLPHQPSRWRQADPDFGCGRQRGPEHRDAPRCDARSD